MSAPDPGYPLFHRLRTAALVLVLTLPAGCVYLGPRAIEGSRTDYNIAMQTTESEQMLLNLVRLRYRDQPYFLEANALNTQFLFAPSASANGLVNLGGSDSVMLGGAFLYEEKPTVTYTPLKGEAFVRQVLSRVALDTILLLDASGWNGARVLRLCVERANGLENAPRASGPTPKLAPDVASFVRAAELLSYLDENGTLSVVRSGDDGGTTLLSRAPDADPVVFGELADLLGLDPRKTRFTMTQGEFGASDDRIDFQTRSFMGVLYFLSQAVDVPAEHVAAGKVTVTLDRSGTPFEWSRVMDGLMHIQSSSKRPEDAAIAVAYRGYWYFIDDADLESKSTFSLLTELFALQSKGDHGRAPILTLPVGG